MTTQQKNIRKKKIAIRFTRSMLLLGFLLLNMGGGVTPAQDISAQGKSVQESSQRVEQQVRELILQLGSNSYLKRKIADRALQKIGAEAFDQLDNAREDLDPEVAARAKYLLEKIGIEWSRTTDSKAVIRIMKEYKSSPEYSLHRTLYALKKLPDREGALAICRIVRFSRKPLDAKSAALAILDTKSRGKDEKKLTLAEVQRELGSSRRVAAAWVRAYYNSQPSAGFSTEENVSLWRRLIAAEEKVLTEKPKTSSEKILRKMLRQIIQIYFNAKQSSKALGVMDEILETYAEEAEVDEMLGTFIEDYITLKDWEGLGGFTKKYTEKIDKNKTLLYLFAQGLAKQKKLKEAEEVAEKAFKQSTEIKFGQLVVSEGLVRKGFEDWAVRELQGVLKEAELISDEGLLARYVLIALYRDAEEYQKCFDIISPVRNAIKNRRGLKLYEQFRRMSGRGFTKDKMTAEMEYWQACVLEKKKEYQQQRDQLQLAYNSDKNNPDILIAMFKSSGATKAYQKSVSEKITEALKACQKSITEASLDSELDADSRAELYNRYAWLAANTEGDLSKAIKYSLRSLELQPGSGGYLDTLAHCYAAKKEYKKAVEAQKKAVKLMPYTKALQRTLRGFEEQLAKITKETGSK